MLLSIIFSALLVYILKPFVVFFERRGFSRTRAVAVVFSGMTAIAIVISVFFLMPILSKMSDGINNDLPLYRETLYKNLGKILGYLSDKFPFLGIQDVDAFIDGIMAVLPRKMLQIITDILPQVATMLLLIPLFTFFLLKDGPRLRRWIINRVPNSHFEMALHLLHRINVQSAQYIRGVTIETLLLSIIITLLLLPSGLKYTVPLGFFAGIANLIPYLGPLIGAIPAVVVALMLDLSPERLIYIPIAVIVIPRIIDDLVLTPVFIARYSNLHPVIVFVSIVIGGKIMGIIGMVIAIPVVSLMNIFIHEVHAFYKFRGSTQD
ncbi:MAG: AI-2E family transporter [Thermodesulfovibrionales bacterium]